MKIIGRISAKGNTYFQTSIMEEGKEESTFVPVFIKKSLEGKFDFTSKERKIDKRGVVYDLYEIPDKNAFKKVDEEGNIKFILTK